MKKRIEMVDGDGDDDDDVRREAAMASTPLFRPTFKSSKVSQAQIDKLKELHQKRLEIKKKGIAKAKHNESTNTMGKICKKDLGACSSEQVHSVCKIKSSTLSSTTEKSCLDESVESSALKKRKLHWGLDAKERWERKANM